MKWQSILQPESSVMAGVAVAGSVAAIYNLQLGAVSQAHASDANHPALAASRKKAALTCFALVSGVFLVTRDGNIAILGWGTIIAMDLTYRHAIMVDPESNRMVPVGPSAYQNAQTAVPVANQGPSY